MYRVFDRATEMNKFWWDFGKLAADTNLVMTMRVMGMSGTWSVPRGEGADMLSEKIPAFTQAMTAGVLTAMSGGGPDRVMQAVLEPISDKARENCERLSDRGPRVFGPLTPAARRAV
ncbi:MAG: antifreeze protein [Sedimentitalea sp.]